MTAENFAVRLAQANLASQTDIAGLVKTINFDDKLENINKNITSNKSKHFKMNFKMILVQNELLLVKASCLMTNFT